MNLNLYIIRDYLNQAILHQNIHHSLIFCPFDSVTLYYPGQTVLANYLYVIDGEVWMKEKEYFAGGNFVIWNWDGQCEGTPSINSIGLSPEPSIHEIFFQIQQIFSRFQKWELELYGLLANHAPFKKYGDISLGFLENPICMYTAGLRNIFYSERKKAKNLMLFTEEDADNFLPYDDIEGLRLNPEFTRTIDQTEPTIFPDDFWGYRILYDNIRVQGLYIARLMVCEVERPLRSSDYALLHMLSTMIQHGIANQEMAINSHPQYFDDYILRLIHREPVSVQELLPVLEKFQWAVNDSYFCVLIPISTYDQAISTVSTFCIKLESLISGCAALEKDSHIVLLVNLRNAASTRDEILANLIYLLRENLLKAGISSEFSDLWQLYHYYNQAENALHIGAETNPTLWYYRYEHYAYRHLLKRALGDSTIESICPSGLQKLLSYDLLHNRQYTRSLKVYLEEDQSVTRTIRKLYMQRSTFIYQLKRIEEISALNLSEKSCKIHLLLVFQIMEESGYQLP